MDQTRGNDKGDMLGGMLVSRKRMKDDPDDDVTPAKRTASDVKYSNFSQRMMASMGYVPGRGLGKDETGIAEPISESTNKGRRGLGFILDGLEAEDVKWEFEEVVCDQKPEWLDPNERPPLTIEDLAGWICIGDRKSTIDDETTFCDSTILKKILDSKTIFDNLSSKVFLEARTKSNPFETIKGAIFQNRAAMKMANIDAALNFMFTGIEKKSDELLYFADLCAGPGGFSEYVLWRKKWHAKGFGFTLKDPESGSDFKLDSFLAAPCETLDLHYGVGGFDGDGDITKPDNIEEFKEYVLSITNGVGVDFVMADGGISVEGQENIQEILTKQLVLCQYLCALAILREGGNFVCKIFDMFTPFSVGLFYLLYRCFKRVCLFKPVTSRPANSERYVVCEHFYRRDSVVEEYMKVVNLNLIELKETKPDKDVLSVVPPSVLDGEILFKDYVTLFNNSIYHHDFLNAMVDRCAQFCFGLNQITNLKKLQYFVKNSGLRDDRQSDIRRKCLDLWKVPNQPRTTPHEKTPQLVFEAFWKRMAPSPDLKVLHPDNFHELTEKSMKEIADIHSWKWCWACGKRYMILSLGRRSVQAWDPKSSKIKFEALKDLQGLELPDQTLLEIELQQEYEGEGGGQRKRNVAYILDVIAIHGEMMYSKPFKERVTLAEKLCNAVNKPCRKGSVQIRTKQIYRLAQLKSEFAKLELKNCKGKPGLVPTCSLDGDGTMFIAPIGILIFNIMKDPWHLHLSKGQKLYYYNAQNKQSTFECPPNALASFNEMIQSRYLWLWNRAIFQDLCSEEENLGAPILNRSKFCAHIQNHLR